MMTTVLNTDNFHILDSVKTHIVFRAVKWLLFFTELRNCTMENLTTCKCSINNNDLFAVNYITP